MVRINNSHEKDVTGMISPNPYLFNCFLWEYHFNLRLFIYVHILRNTNGAYNKGYLYFHSELHIFVLLNYRYIHFYILITSLKPHQHRKIASTEM